MVMHEQALHCTERGVEYRPSNSNGAKSNDTHGTTGTQSRFPAQEHDATLCHEHGQFTMKMIVKTSLGLSVLLPLA